jgi:hypothetical protein
VQARQPITTTFDNNYETDWPHWGLYADVYNLADESGASAAQFRVCLDAGQLVNIRQSNFAQMLKIVDPEVVVVNRPLC